MLIFKSTFFSDQSKSNLILPSLKIKSDDSNKVVLSSSEDEGNLEKKTTIYL